MKVLRAIAGAAGKVLAHAELIMGIVSVLAVGVGIGMVYDLGHALIAGGGLLFLDSVIGAVIEARARGR